MICEIMNEDGTMARVPQLLEFCRRYGLKMISVADLIRYRMQTEKFIRREAEGPYPHRRSANSILSAMSAISTTKRILR